MKDGNSGIKFVASLVPAVVTATTEGVRADLQGFASATLMVNTGAIAGDGLFVIALQPAIPPRTKILSMWRPVICSVSCRKLWRPVRSTSKATRVPNATSARSSPRSPAHRLPPVRSLRSVTRTTPLLTDWTGRFRSPRSLVPRLPCTPPSALRRRPTCRSH